MVVYCFDCESQTWGAALCRSCRDHRADAHPPTQYEQTNRYPVTSKRHTERWYCHGAGPSGITRSRLIETPRPLERHELASRPEVEAVAG